MRPSNHANLAGLSMPADISSLEPLRSFVLERFESTGLSPALALKIDLVLEEVLLNIFHYAYGPDQAGMVSVECGPRADEGRFLVRFLDQGPPFDPLSQPPPDVTLSMDERVQGGLGILLTKKMSASQQYRREGDSNVLEIVFAE
ncbi:ATP-binding protein [Desulfonatronum sp. SC1]|uniref:ATP-binding protein n=1 Tax=Desulfonatronum sp. SC1 TaxID=2109626 RepID=UPI000D30B091|nr:ATP-binding protein [Desulfonatronum sp. SC1]PTN37555.1 ATP-binding protein [Desulfonatronum sp. SC1]